MVRVRDRVWWEWGLNYMKWRERPKSERDLYEDGCAVHEKVDEHYKISPRHTHPNISVCVIQREWVEHWKNRSLRSWPKLSVSRTVCVLTHKRS